MTDPIIESRLRQRMPGSWPLLSDTQKLACIIAYSIGFDDGFQIANATESGIVSVQNKINEIEGSDIQPGTSLRGNSSGAALSLEEMDVDSISIIGEKPEPLDQICSVLKNIPGSGYEFLNR